MIILNVCLSAIPADKRFKGKDGKIYANIIATELKAPDKFDNTHTVYMSQTKEEREAKADKQYIGRGRKLFMVEVSQRNRKLRQKRARMMGCHFKL